MKKIILSAVAILVFGFASAQETKFGVKAGVDLATMKAKVDTGFGTVEATGSETGFFVGGFVNFGLSEKFSIQPEVMYVAITDSNFLSVPILAKYSIANSFSLIAGPSLNYFMDAEEDEFKVNVDFGAIYDITENLDVNAKYSLGMGDVQVSGIFIGVGYKF